MEKKKRSENWSLEEKKQLVEGYSCNVRVLDGKFSSSLTAIDKTAAWERVAEFVNSCSMTKRGVEETKKKWSDLKSQTKKKERRRRLLERKTGGGPAPPALDDWEEKIISIIPDTVIYGIDEGVDSFSGVEEVESIADADHEVAACIEDAPTTSQTFNQAIHFKEKEKESAQKGKAAKASSKSPSGKNNADMMELMVEQTMIQREMLAIKKQRLECEKKKVEQLEKTNRLLQEIVQFQQTNASFCSNSTFYSTDELVVSPVLKCLQPSL